MPEPGDIKRWDAATYDRRFRFVTTYGEDLLEWLAPQPGERVLDLGCGTGELTARIAGQGAEVVGLDQDPDMIQRARSRYPELRFELADAHGFSLADGTAAFDAVFSNAALHWMLRPAEVIAAVEAALRPGGRFVAEAGGQGNVARVERALHQARAEAGAPPRTSPWFFPSIGTYGRLLEEGGLEPRHMQLFDRPTALGEGDDGLAGWITMFASPFLADLTPAQRAQVLGRTKELTRLSLFRDGQWWADYRRLRFAAVCPHK